MKAKYVFLLFLLLSLSTSQNVKCSFISVIGGWFGDMVDGALRKTFDRVGELIEKAKRAFTESMDYLFDKKLVPLINQIDAMIKRNLDHIDEIIQKTIDHFKNSVLEIIDKAVNKAKELIGETIEAIKEKIIDHTFDRIHELESKIVSDIIQILNRIDETIYKLSCSAQAIEIRVRDDLMKNLSLIPNPFDHCRIQIDKMFPGHNLKWKQLKNYGNNELYELKKCNTLKGINEHTPVKSILLAYGDAEFLAAEMRCLSIAFGATENLKHYLLEMGEIASIICTYSDASASQSLPSSTDSTSLVPYEETLKFLN